MTSKRIASSSPGPSRPASSRKRFSAPLPFTRLVGGGSGAVPGRRLGGGIAVWMWVLPPEGNRLEVAATLFGQRGTMSVIGGCSFHLFFVIANLRLMFHSPDESKHSRLLFISSFDIWDCTDLESLQEVLNINTDRNPVDGSAVDSEWNGRVVRAAVVPEPRRSGAKDPFRGDRPLIGVL
jgi:hypothetical protein